MNKCVKEWRSSWMCVNVWMSWEPACSAELRVDRFQPQGCSQLRFLKNLSPLACMHRIVHVYRWEWSTVERCSHDVSLSLSSVFFFFFISPAFTLNLCNNRTNTHIICSLQPSLPHACYHSESERLGKLRAWAWSMEKKAKPFFPLEGSGAFIQEWKMSSSRHARLQAFDQTQTMQRARRARQKTDFNERFFKASCGLSLDRLRRRKKFSVSRTPGAIVILHTESCCHVTTKTHCGWNLALVWPTNTVQWIPLWC